MDEADLDELIASGAAALKPALDGPVGGVPHEVELRFWEPDLGVRHRQRFIDGRLIEWTRDLTTNGTGVDLVCTVGELGALLGRPGAGPTLATFRLRDGDTGAIEPPPPFDAITTAALGATPEVPGATCTVGLHFADTPLGSSDVTVEIVDGRPAFSIGAPADPDVVASLRFDLTLRYMTGDIGLMDMLTGGSVTGDWPQLMLLAGIIESPEFRAAVGPARPRFRQLADAVAVLSLDSYHTALRRAGRAGAA